MGGTAGYSIGKLTGSLAMLLFAIGVVIAAVRLVMLPDSQGCSWTRSSEVRQNLHQIQLAIERYATDNDGTYPYFLYGGELNFNIGTINGVNAQNLWRIYPSEEIHQPFDNFWDRSAGQDYTDCSWEELCSGGSDMQFGDELERQGYLPQYPRNPFATGEAARRPYSLAALDTNFQDHACFGGRAGERMWNLAWFGEAPQLMFFSSPEYEPVRLEYPGSFAYLPRWSDNATNSGHLLYRLTEAGMLAGIPDEIKAPLATRDVENVASHDISGYDLLAYGSSREKGMDCDVSILNGTGNHFWRSGYVSTFSSVRNPWVQEGLWEGRIPVRDFDPRPENDGIDDFAIIQLGSGMDEIAPGGEDVDNPGTAPAG